MSKLGDLESMEELRVNTMIHLRTEGYGVETKSILPCPFCASPDWLVFPVTAGLNGYVEEQKPRFCKNCCRTARVIIVRSKDSVTFEIVQTDGPEPPEWMQPKPRREETLSAAPK